MWKPTRAQPVLGLVALKDAIPDISSTYQGGCPGMGKLGYQSGVLHASGVDPLERLFGRSTYTFGGVQRYITSIATAIQAFTDREYPDVGGKGLAIVRDLPSPQDGITWEDLSKHCIEERHGGLVEGQQCLMISHRIGCWTTPLAHPPCA